MKKFIGAVLVASMVAGTAGNIAFASIDANDSVFGYQKMDFEKYELGSKPLAYGKTTSDDGLLQGTMTSYKSTGDGDFEIVGDASNKYLKATTYRSSMAESITFKCTNNDASLNNDMDYFVKSFKLKNGDSDSNVTSYLTANQIIRFSDSTILPTNSSFGEGSKNITPYSWNEYMLVADKAQGKCYIAINGEITNIVGIYDSFGDVEKFYGNPFQTIYSAVKSGENVFYIDDYEMYGVKSASNEVRCSLEKDAENNKVIYATFNHPVRFDASNVSVSNGGAVSSVNFDDGKYTITLSSIPKAGCTVSVANVEDIFGTVGGTASVSIDAPEVNEVKYGYQKVDFEKYNVGDNLITSGTSSADGLWQVQLTDGEHYDIVSANGSKALRISTDAGVQGGYISNYNNNPEINDSGIDYFVMSYDLRNGSETETPFAAMALCRNSIREDSGTEISNYGQGWQLTSSVSTYKFDTAKAWHHYDFILNKAASSLAVYVDGVNTGLTYNVGTNNTADAFYRLQFWSMYSFNPNQVCYVDNMEMYGLKSDEISLKCKVTVPEAGSNKAYVEFNHPVDFTSDKIMGVDVASVKFVDGKYEVELANLAANTDYTIMVTEVTDVYGASSSIQFATFKTGLVENEKTYLGTDARFNGADDFEGYDNVGIIESATNPKVDIRKNGYKIDDIYPTWVGNAGGVEYSLADLGGNKAFKVGIPGEALSGEYSTIFQPKPDINWTSAAEGKIFVYKMDVKSGGNGEAPFYTVPFGVGGYYVNFYFSNNYVEFNGVKESIDSSKFNTLEYIIDKTGATDKITAVINGKVIKTVDATVSEIKNSNPRWAVAYPSTGKVNSSMYFDNLEIYTTSGVENNIAVENAGDTVYAGSGVVVKFSNPVVSFDYPATVKSVTALEDNKYLISFKDALEIGDGSVTLTNVKDIYGNTLSSAKVDYTVVEGGKVDGIISFSKSSDNMNVTIANSGAKVDGATIYVAAYTNGILTGVELLNTSIEMGTNDYKVSGTVSGNTYKVFAWDTETLEPLCKAY